MYRNAALLDELSGSMCGERHRLVLKQAVERVLRLPVAMEGGRARAPSHRRRPPGAAELRQTLGLIHMRTQRCEAGSIRATGGTTALCLQLSSSVMCKYMEPWASQL
jgi:hypothetical protein